MCRLGNALTFLIGSGANDAAFAEAVTAAGLIWVGPPPNAIRDMGDKIGSRKIMLEAGVPIVPGLAAPVADAAEAVAAAKDIGYPIALKASAGGGGTSSRCLPTSRWMSGSSPRTVASLISLVFSPIHCSRRAASASEQTTVSGT
mgnify:CR=1 FL=1